MLEARGPLRVVFALAVSAAFGGATASAQPQMIRCLPPAAPITERPVNALTEYRNEIAAEFEAHFSLISTHIAHLDAERSRAMEESSISAATFNRLINTVRTKKELP